jgi:dTDP-4-dehydrorhamnose reductase
VTPIVVLGAEGMLGRAVCERLKVLDRPYRALGRAECDLTSDEAIARAVTGTHLVVNCAAYTNVDGAESDPATAMRVNGTAVGSLGHHCREIGAALIHFSTDYVFDGRATRPYPVEHPKNPLGVYGRSKALGETLLGESGADFLSVRTSWLYAAWGRNFVRTMAQLLQTRPRVQVVHDQRGRPTEAEALARNTLALFDAGCRGTFHLTDGGECSWYELAKAVAQVIGSDAEVVPCTTAEFPRPAPRPNYSVLDTTDAERVLGPLIPFERQLERIAPALREA